MKKILYFIMMCMISAIVWSCKKIDNYAAPDQTFKGSIIDSVTGQPLQADPNEMRLATYDLSYASATGTIMIPYYFDIMPNGTFVNTKVFKDTYRIYPTDGAFVPLVFTNSVGVVVDNGSKTLTIQGGTTTANFTVAPFLEVTWVGEPVVNNDKTVTVQFQVNRGTSNPSRQFNLTDVYLFVSTTAFVSNGSFDNKLSNQVTYSGTAGNALLGQTITVTTKAPLGSARQYFVRVGARTADNVNKRYNYTTPKSVLIP